MVHERYGVWSKVDSCFCEFLYTGWFRILEYVYRVVQNFGESTELVYKAASSGIVASEAIETNVLLHLRGMASRPASQPRDFYGLKTVSIYQ